ncbi:hypothetical protein GCM10029992_48640 [Glycomyces albus]
MPAKALLAIDFGTSNTVAVLRQTGTADRPLLFAGSPVMPSAVFLDDDGRFHTGREAERMAQLDPAAFEPHPKQHVGVDLVLLGEREVPAADLAAAVLARVRQAAVEVLGEAPAAVLTHPAQWGPHRIAVLERAAAAADLEVSRLVAEPVAAAHRFAQVESVDSAAGLIGVFDLGGGTFDIAVLRRDRSGRFAVAAQGGQTDLGEWTSTRRSSATSAPSSNRGIPSSGGGSASLRPPPTAAPTASSGTTSARPRRCCRSRRWPPSRSPVSTPRCT